MKWVSVKDHMPEYVIQISGVEYVPIIVADKDGSVWPGDYANGKFMVFGVHRLNITHWMYFPHHPNFIEALPSPVFHQDPTL